MSRHCPGERGLTRKSPAIVNIMRMVWWHRCKLAAKERGLEWVWWTIMGAVDAVEWACALCGCCIQNDWVRNESASHFSVSLNISLQELFRWFRRPQLWATGGLAASSWKRTGSCILSCAEFFGETSNHPGDSAPYSPDLAPCDFWLFLKLKSPLKGKWFQTIDEIQENMTGQLMVTGRTMWGPKVPPLKETEVSLSFGQSFLCPVSSSINVSIFHST